MRFGVTRGLLSFACAVTVMFALYWTGAIAGNLSDNDKLAPISLFWTFFGLIIFAPIVETLILAVLFKVTSSFLDMRLAAVFSGLIVAAGHSIIYWAWGLIVLLSFMIYSAPFASSHIAFKERIAKSWLAHTVHNTLAFLLITMATLSGSV